MKVEEMRKLEQKVKANPLYFLEVFKELKKYSKTSKRLRYLLLFRIWFRYDSDCNPFTLFYNEVEAYSTRLGHEFLRNFPTTQGVVKNHGIHYNFL